nr:hypothetical protein [Tanacetum cinerariifolium]
MYSLNSSCEVAYSPVWIFPRVKFSSRDPILQHLGHDVQRRVEIYTNFTYDDQGTKSDDSRNKLSLRTFSMMNEIDGSGDDGGVVLMFSGLPFSSRPSSSDLSSRDLFGCLGHIVMALIELWIREQDELPSSVGLDFQARQDDGQIYSGHLGRHHIVPIGELNGVSIALMA